MTIGTQSTLTSRFKNIPVPVMRKIKNSPEFKRPDFQEMLQRDQVEIRFQGSKDGQGEIVTTGKVPSKYVADGFLKAALVKLGLTGEHVIPHDEVGRMQTPQEEFQQLFRNVWESKN